MANYVTVITDEGAALLASVIANQGTLTISEMRFSEHDYTGTAQTATAGTFADVFKTASVNSETTDSTTIKSAASFTNSGITSDHPLYAVGLVGTDGNTTALLCVCTTSNPDYIREPIPIANVSRYGFNINLTVSDTDHITVVGTAALILYSTDVIDNLTSTATNKPLSANMGRVLKENLYKRNLLKNGWFTINERGWTSGVPSNDYVANDWLGLAVSPSDIITNNNGTLTLTVDTLLEIKQFLENASELDGLVVTASVKMADDTIKQGTAIFDHSNDLTFFSDTSLTLYYRTSDEYFRLTAYSTITIKAIKLELGTESTLANDIAPDKTLETIRCQSADFKSVSNIFATGTTNTTGAQIDAGTFFYLNGQFCKALTNIAANATFTENTNYKKDTVGSELKDIISKQVVSDSVTANTGTYGNVDLGINAGGIALVDAYTTEANCAVIPFYSASKWFAHIVQYTDYSAVVNTDVTVYFRYIKLV